jgi:tRNA pseudouridine38-40 synthase
VTGPERASSWRLTVAYDGTAFWGSQRQPARRTVQGVLEAALRDFSGQEQPATFAGRTDRGVHAVGQVVSVPDLRPDLAEGVIRNALNARLPDDLAVISVARDGPAFDARRDATWREYRYRIWCGAPAPLIRHVTWQRRSPLDLPPMRAACERLLGRHDFAAFAGGGDGVPWSERRQTRRGTVRTVRRCSIRAAASLWPAPANAAGHAIELRIIADGFLPHMVRAIVGALVEVGSGNRSPDWIADLIRAADRRRGPRTAPPHGLVLWRVGYGHDEPAPDPDDDGTAGDG